MCGIAGVLTLDNNKKLSAEVTKMTDAIKHRGPDDAGIFETHGVCLGHRRLSIIDLSANGHQPMVNEDESITIVFNGEIYNYIELREALKHKRSFKTDSDTEVIIRYYEEYGVECLGYFNGMFAFAIWDSKKEQLFCARDRFGKKPFYYYATQQEFIFSSEIKPILGFPSVKKECNDNAVMEYLLYSLQDHSQETFFKNVMQLEQGAYALINKKDGRIDKKIVQYYDISKKPNQQENTPQEFLKLLQDSVKIRLRSDVPVGILLSGGLDSAAVTRVVYDLSEKGSAVKLFTAAAHEKEVDESAYAIMVAKELGFKHEVIYPDGTQLLKDLATITLAHEKPIPGTSVFAHYHIMKAIQKFDIKVILQGQGSDELLGGYDNFYNPYLAQYLRRFKLLTYFKELKACAGKADVSVKRLMLSSLNKAFNKPFSLQAKFNNNLAQTGFAKQLGTHGQYQLKKFSGNVFTNDLYNYMKVNNLPYILHYEDRNSMMVSIESRTPFLDYRLVDFCFNLPMEQKIHKGVRKVILKQAMRKKLPDAIIDRQKMGFPTPTRKWLTVDSKAELLEIFNSEKFKESPFFDQSSVLALYQKYCEGERQHEPDLWKVIAVHTWHQLFFN